MFFIYYKAERIHRDGRRVRRYVQGWKAGLPGGNNIREIH